VSADQPERPRLRACVEAWPDAHEGGYDPRCCRFPKSCSADVYDPAHVTAEDLECPAMTAPERVRPADEHTGTVALDLDAIEAAALADDGWWSVPVLALVAEVRRLTAEAATQREWFEAADAAAERRLDQSIAWMERAEAAEAEVVTLRARLAAVEETLHDADATSEFLAASGDTHDAAMAGAVFAVTDNVRAALATTGEGE